MPAAPRPAPPAATDAVTSPLADDQRERLVGPTERVAIVVLLLWLLVCAVMLSRHEMWRDELQTWSIARDASSPVDFIPVTRYAGHPPFWYLVLWIASRVSRQPMAMQLVNLAVMGAAAYLVLLRAPFRMRYRILVVFGYFPLFEYGVVSRSYGLAFLLIASYLVSSSDGRRIVLPVTLLCLASNTTVVAIPLVFGLLCAWWVDSESALRRRRRSTQAIAIGSVVAGSAVALALSRPPSDGVKVEAGNVDSPVADALRSVVRVMYPIPDNGPHFWNSYLTSSLGILEVILGASLLVVLTWWFSTHRPALVVWLVGGCGYLVATFTYGLPTFARHLSMVWLAGLSACWIMQSSPLGRSTRGRVGSPVILTSLVVSVVAAAFSIGVDYARPFSGGEAVAGEIVAEEPGAPVVCVAIDVICSTVAVRLDQPAIIGSTEFTYVVWKPLREAAMLPDDAFALASNINASSGKPVAVIVPASEIPAWCTRRFVSPDPIVADEALAVCWVPSGNTGP